MRNSGPLCYREDVEADGSSAVITARAKRVELPHNHVMLHELKRPSDVAFPLILTNKKGI